MLLRPCLAAGRLSSWLWAHEETPCQGHLPGSAMSPVPSCRKCGPRLSAAAAEKLKNRYILMRSGSRQHEQESDRRSSIPITVR